MRKSKSNRRDGWAQKPKLNLSFDSKARVEYLSGFHKRKLERKAFYKAKLERQLGEEKKRIKEQVKKSSVGKVSSSHSILPEVEALLGLSERNTQTTATVINSFVLGSKVVTVSSLDDIHLKPSDITHSDSEADAEAEAEEDESQANDSSDKRITQDLSESRGTSKGLLKKTASRMLQHSKAYKASQRLKHKSKKSRGQKDKNRSQFSRKSEGAPENSVSSRPIPMKRKGQPRLKKNKKS